MGIRDDFLFTKEALEIAPLTNLFRGHSLILAAIFDGGSETR